jgi:phosphoribosylformylglycinamidine synthase subunit PurS
MSYKAEVRIALKKGVADPEGKNTHKALELLGFQGLQSVKSEKLFEIRLDAASEEVARHRAEEMCKRLLANPVIHDYTIAVHREA